MVERIEDKGVLLLGCVVMGFLWGMGVFEVMGLFCCVTLACLSEYMEKRSWVLGGYGGYIFVMALIPNFVLGIPVLIYDLAGQRRWGWLGVVGVWTGGILAGQKVWNGAGMVNGAGIGGDLLAGAGIFVVLAGLAAVFLAWRTREYLSVKSSFVEQRDASREMELWLKEKNRNLMDKQEYEIRLATLRERTRIAREIHDNVGHMLSRSILQTAALSMISKEQAVKEQLGSLSETLNLAMDSIRESVHDLHDDSIQLEYAVEKMLEGYENYKIQYEYAIEEEVPREIKFCFLTVVKEALSNVAKHSDATAIRVVIQEFQDYYQLLFQDNGTGSREAQEHRGMGLENIKERVEILGGTVNICREQGFRIFLSVPKQRKR